MIRIKILLVLFAFATLHISASTDEDIEENKVTLTYLQVKDDAIKFAATDVHQMILRKNKGFLWPATKIVLSKKDDKLFFDITAIDNSWCNIFCADEKPYGYFVVGGRMFVVASKGETPVHLEDYFELDDEVERNFYKPGPSVKPVSANPVWNYYHKGTMATVLNSTNMASLGR